MSTWESNDKVLVALAVGVQPASLSEEILGVKGQGEKGYGLDLSVTISVMVVDARGVAKGSASVGVGELPEGVELTVALPGDFSLSGKDVRVARSHGGTVDFIPAQVDDATNAVTFSTDRFSDYAVLAADRAPEPLPDPDPEPVTHKVSFVDRFNNVTSEVDVVDGQAVAKPADPSFAGYEFVGWFVDEGAKSLYDFDAPVGGDLTLYAGYRRVEPAPAEDGPSDNATAGAAVEKSIETPAAKRLAQTGDVTLRGTWGIGALGVLLTGAAVLALRRCNRNRT